MKSITLQVTEAEEGRIRDLLTALRTALDFSPGESFVGFPEAFFADFEARLLAHHVFLGHPLYMESFDSAFISAACMAGIQAVAAVSGQRFWDADLDGRRISLKSTKAKGLRVHSLHISKLTEAAWLQDCRSARKRHAKTMELFELYCSTVDEIIQLRYFRKTQKYELVGFDTRLLRQVLDVPVSEFNADGPSINIPVGSEERDFTLKLDRSDAKVTLANINKQRCKVYGTWTFP